MAITLKTLVDHPFSFAVGVGAANGLLAKSRNKQIDLRVAATLGAIIGIGEVALVAYEAPYERGPIMSKMSLMEIGLYSIAGLYVGLIPFITWKLAAEHPAHPMLVAETGTKPTAVSGYAQRGRRKKRIGAAVSAW
jgi:hypothetical protein